MPTVTMYADWRRHLEERERKEEEHDATVGRLAAKGLMSAPAAVLFAACKEARINRDRLAKRVARAAAKVERDSTNANIESYNALFREYEEGPYKLVWDLMFATTREIEFALKEREAARSAKGRRRV